MPAPFATAPAAQSNPLLSCQFQPEAEQSCGAEGGAGDRGLTEEGNFRVSVFLLLLGLRNLRLGSREHEYSTVHSHTTIIVLEVLSVSQLFTIV